MDGFRDGYADAEEVKRYSFFSSRDSVITDINGVAHTREEVEAKREEMARGVRNTLLSQMRSENARSLDEALNMQEAHKAEYQGMTRILKELKEINLRLEDARINNLKAHQEAGENVTDSRADLMSQMIDRAGVLFPDRVELQGQVSERSRQTTGAERPAANENVPGNTEDSQSHDMHEQNIPQTDPEMAELNEGKQIFYDHLIRLSMIQDENNSLLRPRLSWWGKMTAARKADKSDREVSALEKNRDQTADILKAKAESWNRRRKSYYEGSFRKAYERYDMAARRYRIMTRGEDTSREFQMDEHGKNIREYRGEFDMTNLQSLIDKTSTNPYMVSDKLAVRDWENKSGYSSSEENRLIKSHRRILLQSEEKNEDGHFERIKIRSLNPEEGVQSDVNRNLGRVEIYSARRQFKTREGETVLSEGERHVLSENTTLYDDAMALNGELIFSKDTAEYFEVRKKGNRKQTTYGIFLLGEFISGDESIVRDRREVADNEEGRFSLKQRGDLEKTVYAMKKSAFFNHVNTRSLQYYMGYRAHDEYAGKIEKMMRKGFENPLRREETEENTYDDHQTYYDMFAGIFDEGYLSDANENSPDILPNLTEASLERYMITGIPSIQAERSINKREESDYVMVKVLIDRMRYDKKRKKTLFDDHDQRIPHSADEVTTLDKLLDKINSLKQGKEILRKTAIWLLSTENPENWKIAKGICLDKSLLNLGDSPAFKTRMKLAKADDGMIWRMEVLDELSHDRSFNNEKLLNPAKQVIEEDKLSQRGQVVRDRQFAKIMVKSAADMASNAISVINLDINNKWLKMSKTFVSTLSSLYPDNYTNMLSGALKELGEAGLAAGLLSDLNSTNEKNRFKLFDDDGLVLSSVVNILKSSYIMYHFCRKNPDPEKLDMKKIIPLTRSMIDLWSTVMELFSNYTALDPTGFMGTIFSIVNSGLDIFRNSIDIDEANKVQDNVDGLLSVKKEVEEKVKRNNAVSPPSEYQKEVVNRFRESGQYEYALFMARNNADRREVGGKVAVAKDSVDIIAALVGLSTGRVGKILSKATAKLIGTGMDLGMMKYSMVKDEKETREDLLGKGLKNDKLDIDSISISKMDKSVLTHALNRTTGIVGFDYLLDASRMMVAVDIHCAFQHAYKRTGQPDPVDPAEAHRLQTEKNAHKAVALSIAKAIMPDKYSEASSADDLKEVRLSDVQGALGFSGNRIMFSRNAIGFDKTVRSYSDIKKY